MRTRLQKLGRKKRASDELSTACRAAQHWEPRGFCQRVAPAETAARQAHLRTGLQKKRKNEDKKLFRKKKAKKKLFLLFSG